MTTDEFHRQLVENTEAINKERMAYERKKIQLQQECDCQKSLADSILESIQRERQELELEFSSKKSSLNDRERNAHESRRKATELYLTGMAEAKATTPEEPGASEPAPQDFRGLPQFWGGKSCRRLPADVSRRMEPSKA